MMYKALSTLNGGEVPLTEVPLSKAPNPQLLSGCCSINGSPTAPGVCVFTAVSVLGMARYHNSGFGTIYIIPQYRNHR